MLDKALGYRLNITEATLSFAPGLSPLQTAVVHGQDEAVAWFLDHGADLTHDVRTRCECQNRMTCVLHTAFCLGHTSTAHLLISRGAPLEYPSPDPVCTRIGTTNALLEASLYGFDTVVDVLVKDYGMDLQTQHGDYHYDALACAAMNSSNVSMIRALVGLGADVDGSRKEWHSSPLHVAIHRGNFAVAHVLLDLGAHATSYKFCVNTISMSAYTGENMDRMIQKVIRVEPTPLHDAIASTDNREERASTQERHLASFNYGELTESWRAERIWFMKRLIGLGADINMKADGDWSTGDSLERSPLYLATVIGDEKDMAMLIAAGAKVETIFLEFAFEGFGLFPTETLAKIKLLLDHGARLDEEVMGGLSLLELAAKLTIDLGIGLLLHELLLLSSPKVLSDRHLQKVLEHCLTKLDCHASTILVYHGARVSDENELCLLADILINPIRDLGLGTQGDELPNLDPATMDFEPGLEDCIRIIIDMGLSRVHQCFIFQKILEKSQLGLAHLLLDRGLAGWPETAPYMPSYLMTAANWGNVCVMKRLWLHARKASDELLRLSLVQKSIIRGDRRLVSFFMNHGATPFDHMTPIQVSQQRQLREKAIAARVDDAAAFALEGSEDSHNPWIYRPHMETQLLTARYALDDRAEIYMWPFLSPLGLAVRLGHIDIISDLLDHVAWSQADTDAISRCGSIHIPCVLARANEIREMIQKKGIQCGSDQ